MARTTPRTAACVRRDATNRLQQADAFVFAAELVLDDRNDIATPGVAAALAVLGGIAGADAACCARLGKRARGQAHADAVRLVSTVKPHGSMIAKDLKRLVDRKDASHYGVAFVSAAEAEKMVVWAKRLCSYASKAVEA